jgi:hypothetical protein
VRPLLTPHQLTMARLCERVPVFPLKIQFPLKFWISLDVLAQGVPQNHVAVSSDAEDSMLKMEKLTLEPEVQKDQISPPPIPRNAFKIESGWEQFELSKVSRFCSCQPRI